ncbi:MAG: LOG family protein [Candidatus Marinimicrobia bacterium]|nr:LOG family protein [Candidatus Neomarinimicrobiota bacterium]
MSDQRKDRFYFDTKFVGSPDGRVLRILAEYFGPLQRFRRNKIADTIVFFGSARIKSQEEAQDALKNAPKKISKKDKNLLKRDLDMSRYYEDARKLAFKLTKWSMGLKEKKKRFIITSGGGPGIMEASNRGASEAKGLAVGLNITLPFEASGNKWISKDLSLYFHYFFMRKFWFLYLSKALVIFPGGFGTLDELMELLTLIQTKKIRKKLPIVIYDSKFWKKVIDFDYLVEMGTISKEDMDLFYFADTIDDAYTYLTKEIVKAHLQGKNF